MKTNAIIRIIIWSLVIVTLLGILSIGLGVTRILPSRTIAASPAATEIPIRVDENGNPIDVPPIAMDSNANTTAVKAEGIRDIGIEWAAGAIKVIPTAGDVIRIYETGDVQKYPMVVQQKKDKLEIQYCHESLGISFGINYDFTKDLTIEIPVDFFLQELEIDAASATVTIQELSIGNVEFDGASGVCQFQDCRVDSLDIDTASGDVHFTGTLNVLECDAASASFIGILSNVPHHMEMDSMSGNLDVTLPADAGFTAAMEGMKSNFTSDFETTSQNGVYIHGDGACRIQMDAMSGEVILRKG